MVAEPSAALTSSMKNALWVSKGARRRNREGLLVRTACEGERGRADRDEQVMHFDLLMTIFPCLERRNYSCNEGAITKW